MPDDDPKNSPALDVLIQWKEVIEEKTCRDEDSFEMTAEVESDSMEVADVETSTATDVEEEVVTGSDKVLEEAEMPSEEVFEWSEEKERAINEALQGAADARIPHLHYQLDDIRRAFERRQIGRAKALELLKEVESYIKRQLEKRAKKAPIADEAVASCRSLADDALYLYLEVIGVFIDFLESGDISKIRMAQRLADQAAGFLLSARTILQQAAPERPEEEDSADGQGEDRDL